MRNVRDIPSTDTAASRSQARRQDWLAVLAHAPRALLAQHAAVIDWTALAWLHEPDAGLAMLRGRTAGLGERFELGEATITRCVVRCPDDGRDTLGVGYVPGHDEERARWVALFDARLQQPAHHGVLMAQVIEPLRAALETQRQQRDRHARKAASRVRCLPLRPERTMSADAR